MTGNVSAGWSVRKLSTRIGPPYACCTAAFGLKAPAGQLFGDDAVLFKEKINFKMPGGDGLNRDSPDGASPLHQG